MESVCTEIPLEFGSCEVTLTRSFVVVTGGVGALVAGGKDISERQSSTYFLYWAANSAEITAKKVTRQMKTGNSLAHGWLWHAFYTKVQPGTSLH